MREGSEETQQHQGQVAQAGHGVDFASELHAVLVRHLQVEHGNVDFRLVAEPCQRFVRPREDVGDHAPAFGLSLQNLAIDATIVDDQDALVGKLGGGTEEVDPAPRLGGLGVDGEEEGGAMALLAAHPDLAAHRLGDALGDDQAEPGAAMPAGDGGVALAEGLEELVEPLRGNARAGVAHLELELQPLAARRCLFDSGEVGVVVRQVEHGDGMARNLNHDLALFGELERVADEVDEDLPQPRRIADDRSGGLSVVQVGQVEILFRGAHAEEVEHLFQARNEVEADLLELKRA